MGPLEAKTPEPLARVLRPADLAFLVVGVVIGSGIFLVPGPVLRQVGGEPSLALAVWALVGAVSVAGALTYGELGAMFPETGGLYVYLRDAFGGLSAFLYGWGLFFVIGSGSVATLAVAFTSYLRELAPLDPTVARGVAVAVIALVAAINVSGTRRSVGLQNWTTALKAGAILVIGSLLVASGDGLGGVRAWPASWSPSLLAGVGAALAGVLWAYEGWQYATFSAGETLDPQRSFPRGILAGTAIVVGLYLLANVAYVAALGPGRAAASDRIAAEAAAEILGPAAGKLVAAAILISIFSAANAVTLTAPRVYFAMAHDRLFFRGLAAVHPRFGTPALSIAASSAWAAVLAASGTFEQLLTYVVFTAWGFYALGGLSLFHYRRRRPEQPRPFRVPGYPWTPLVFVLSSAAIVVATLVAHPRRALVGIGILLLGAPAYWLWRWRSPAVTTPAGS